MALRSLNCLSLCAGVGGLELGIALALHHRGEAVRGVCYVEREGAAAASLVASMGAGWLHPAPVWSNMLTFDARPWRGVVHILASGDPCQDNSVAGQRAGAAGKRFLAPEVCRLAGECRPDLIFRENVPGNADGQLTALVPPLERLGYRVAAGIFSSAETGNTMRRERMFILAERRVDGSGGGRHWLIGGQRDAAGRQEPGRYAGLRGRAVLPPAVIPGPTDSRWIGVLDRWPELQPALSQEEAESHLRRGIDAMAHRVERLRATGNGVDPVVAAYAFLRLDALLAAERARANDIAVRNAA